MLAAGAESPCFQFKFLIGYPAFLVLGSFLKVMCIQNYTIVICILYVLYHVSYIIWEKRYEVIHSFLKISFFIYLFYEI